MTNELEIAMGALRVSCLLYVFWPYTGLLVIAFVLLKGREAADVRNQVVVFTGSVVLGSYLCACWLMMNISPGGPLSIFAEPGVSFPGSVLTKPLLWWIVPVMVALAGHAAIYILSGLRALPRLHRNTVASVLICSALVLGILSPIPQVRFWKTVYTPQAMAEASELNLSSYKSTDSLTERWISSCPDEWESLLLRANFLYNHGRIKEAEEMDRRLLDLPDGEISKDLRDWIQKRLSGRVGVSPAF